MEQLIINFVYKYSFIFRNFLKNLLLRIIYINLIMQSHMNNYLNYNYIKGNIYNTNNTLGPLSQETTLVPEMVNKLLECHKIGILTTFSQPGECITYYENIPIDNEISYKKYFYENRQLPCISGIMLKSHFYNKILKLDNNLITYRIVYPCNVKNKDNYYTSITESRKANTLQELINIPFESETFLSYNTDDLNDYFPILANDKFIEIQFWVNQWGFDTIDFLDHLLNTFK